MLPKGRPRAGDREFQAEGMRCGLVCVCVCVCVCVSRLVCVCLCKWVGVCVCL